MEVLLPRTLEEALEMLATRPEARPIAGGTDLMVELNFGRARPEAMIDVTRIPELLEHGDRNGRMFVGAGVTYARIIRELPDLVPLAQASRTVGSPPIRNRGTIGGNLGTASPAGDALPPLATYEAEVVLGTAHGTRHVPWRDFLTGPKETALAPGELILGAEWLPVRGPGSFSKVGTRNAMVIAVASVTVQLDEDDRAVRVALGSAGPTILRSPEAEAFGADALATAGVWDEPGAPLPAEALEGFGDRVAATATPIDDVRGSADYRRHACGVLARRALSWALDDRRPPMEEAG